MSILFILLPQKRTVKGDEMEHLLLFTKMTITRIKNRIYIHLAKRPEVVFFFVLLVAVLMMGLIAIYSFVDTTFDVHIHLFPTMFYTLVLAVLFPYGALELKRSEPIQEHSIFELMIGHKKYLFLTESVKFLVSGVYAFGLLFLILSRMSNIDLLSSILFWHGVSMLILFISVLFSKITLIVIKKLFQSIALSFMSLYKCCLIIYYYYFYLYRFKRALLVTGFITAHCYPLLYYF
jgi:hypothetical protein